MQTIFALSSGAPPAAIAVVRISGGQAMAVAERLAQPLPPPRRAARRRLIDPATGDPLDDAILLVFPGPGTATGEDLVELHLHGGRAVVARVLSVLAAQSGLRMAEPGEFTRRALMHGRIDLTEAEGLGDLLAAETEDQRRAALASAEGGVRRQVEQWQHSVLMLSAGVEAVLDHGDEGDVDDDPQALEPIRQQAAALANSIADALQNPPVERLRDGIRVVLAGPPNAGKSTLLNRLTDRDAAITSPIAGTTRDRIEVPVQRNGIAWVFIDTAGLASDTADPIEAMGIERSHRAMVEADILVWLGDDAPPGGEAAIPNAIAVYPRTDEPGRAGGRTGSGILLSAVTGEGIADLWTALEERVSVMIPRLDGLVLNQRQHVLLGKAQHALSEAAQTPDPLLLAEELRSARTAFDRITGRADVEAMLDSLFGRFCIGK
ncbi:tRNA uridine-5-carboxymethylaminomethyl(34) synthesis GTPase MnmE [Sphingomonas sp. CJ99]